MGAAGYQADVENTATWIKYKKKLCSRCLGVCCSLPVEVNLSDLVRLRLIDAFDVEEPAKQIARRLMKERKVEHFHAKSQTFTLARMASGDCIFLDHDSRRCTVYDLRPDTCRNHPQIGPRSGYCAFQEKEVDRVAAATS